MSETAHKLGVTEQYARSMAIVKMQAAQESRRLAHRARRWGYQGQFHEYMRRAIREWKNFKFYRRATQ